MSREGPRRPGGPSGPSGPSGWAGWGEDEHGGDGGWRPGRPDGDPGQWADEDDGRYDGAGYGTSWHAGGSGGYAAVEDGYAGDPGHPGEWYRGGGGRYPASPPRRAGAYGHGTGAGYPGGRYPGDYPADGGYPGGPGYPGGGGHPGSGSYRGGGYAGDGGGGYPGDRYPDDRYPGGGHPGRGGYADERYPGGGSRPPWDSARGYGDAGGGYGDEPHAGPPWEDAHGGHSGYGGQIVPGFGEAPAFPGQGFRPPSPGGGAAAGRAAPRRPAKRRRPRWLVPLIVTLAILVPLSAGGLYGFRFVQGRYFPADYPGDGSGHVIVQVRSGDTATAVGQRLLRLGVVASVRAFVLAAEHSSDQTGLEPGFYRLHRHMKASLAFRTLLNPASRVQVAVTIPEGWRVSQIVAALGGRSGIPASDYTKALADPAALGLPPYAHGNPEGYLFPATYEIQPGMNATSVLKAMVARFSQAAAGLHLTREAARVHLTPGQVIIVASLIQAEGGRISDYPKIAEVIYNRLARNMKLQLDSTVMYALHAYGILASTQQLRVASPYNTYLHTGLPPGPIDNPGAAAIRAALHPEIGSYLYFVTVNPRTGQTEFTASQAVFEQLRAELEKNLGAG
ncbi:MAG TPA: endolytic transglycosylase MltG [Streptosporangiaceae bacterium]|nr:endolytic transglycosylase MltG [Streptosporangiaceae bacterium]